MPTVPVTQFSVPYATSLFPARLGLSDGSVVFTAADLAHALFVTGRAPGDRYAFGAASLWELLHRAAIVPAYVRWAAGGRLVRSRLATNLDRSEKMALSYALGQAMTSVFCENVLLVSHLMHVERYAARYGIVFGTRRRPDLFGQSPSGWIVAEAKGRSNAMERDLPGVLVAQKTSVISVLGAPPALALGCVASFPPSTAAMRLDVFDPESRDVEGVALDIDSDRYFLAYYEPFVTAIDEATEVDRVDGTTLGSFVGAGLRIGLLTSVEALVREAQGGSIEGLGIKVRSLLREARDGQLQFRDGSVVETDWDDALRTDDSEEEGPP